MNMLSNLLVLLLLCEASFAFLINGNPNENEARDQQAVSASDGRIVNKREMKCPTGWCGAGTCKAAQDKPVFTCTCPAGTRGKRCQFGSKKKMSKYKTIKNKGGAVTAYACPPNYCGEGGTCRAMYNYRMIYSCVCPKGKTGRRCELDSIIGRCPPTIKTWGECYEHLKKMKQNSPPRKPANGPPNGPANGPPKGPPKGPPNGLPNGPPQ